MSEADPGLLAALCAALLGEVMTPDPLGKNSGKVDNVGGQEKSSSRSTRTAASRRLGPLRARDQNVALQTFGMGGTKANAEGSGSCSGGVIASAAGVAGVCVKGRRMSTPTTSTTGSCTPERKSTRRHSPQKGGSGSVKTKEISMSKDQEKAVDLVLEGKSVFFTGKCGRLVLL